MKRLSVWAISIGGHGSFDFVATESEAEEMRAHKADWERGPGKKFRVRDASPRQLERWNVEGPHVLERFAGKLKVAR